MIKPIRFANLLQQTSGINLRGNPSHATILDQASLLNGAASPFLMPKISFSQAGLYDLMQAGDFNRRVISHHAFSGGAGPIGATASHVFSHNSGLTDLNQISKLYLLENGLVANYSPAAMAQAAKIKAPASDSNVKDLRSLKWISIDNDDSRDLDQIQAAEKLPNGDIKVLVGIADVDALVPKGSAIDQHAALNTATVYTPLKPYHMLPEKLSTDLTSLNADQDRLAVVTEMVVAPDGSIRSSNMYQAMVNNHAKLAYNSTAAWLDGKDPGATDPLLAPLKKDGIAEQVKLQDEAAQRIKANRAFKGFLDFDMQKPEVVVENGRIVGIEPETRNRANELIENLMVASNGVAARFLRAHNFPVIQRVVREPDAEHWSDIVGFAASRGTHLPNDPDSKALEKFLEKEKAKDPVRYPDLALSVLKWMGRGTYELELPGEPPIGHFGLAVKDYTHSTAPNRRYPDLITQRLLKAAMNGKPCPYSMDELAGLSMHCTSQESTIKTVDRHLIKCAAAQFLQSKIGERFKAVVTNVNNYGTFVRVLGMPVEGRIERGHENGAGSGKIVDVKLSGVNVEKGYIDFQVAHGKGKKAA